MSKREVPDVSAIYECVLCSRRWRMRPSSSVTCTCGSIHVRWVNYEKWRVERDRRP